ncbi:C-X-C motif chemokine 10-like isoform X1 [Mixophyes fleayi]|uniref:C-X-C motif chemokine 10-like isoform X1 n=1 Tax=Mixophyes fleayi TaxID=3061075 RepID=UPI003F4E160A
MDSKCVVIICFLLFSATLIQGFAAPQGNRCMCIKLANRLDLEKLEKLEIFQKSSACENTEYIATLKGSNLKRCVRPDLKEVKALLSGKNQHLKHIPVVWHQ